MGHVPISLINALKAGGLVGSDFNPKSAWTAWIIPTPSALDKKLDDKKNIWQTIKGWFSPKDDKPMNVKKGKYETKR